MTPQYGILVGGLISSGCFTFVVLYLIGVKISQIKNKDGRNETKMETLASNLNEPIA